MLRRNWVRYAAFGIAFGLAFLAVAYAFWAVRYFSEYQLRHAYERSNAATEYTNAANPYIEGRCGRVPYLLVNECTTDDVNAEQQEQREKADLNAQQDMSEWALFLALIGLPGFVVSCFGLGALIWTFRETRELTQNQERAVLEVQGGSLWPRMRHSESHMHVDIAVRNIGRTVATDVYINGVIEYYPGQIPASQNWEETWDTKLDGKIITEIVTGRIEQVPAGELDAIISFQPTEIDLSKIHGQEFGSGGPNLMMGSRSVSVRGSVEYLDVFGREQSTAFGFTAYTFHGSAPYYFEGGARNWRASAYLEREQESQERARQRIQKKMQDK